MASLLHCVQIQRDVLVPVTAWEPLGRVFACFSIIWRWNAMSLIAINMSFLALYKTFTLHLHWGLWRMKLSLCICCLLSAHSIPSILLPHIIILWRVSKEKDLVLCIAVFPLQTCSFTSFLELLSVYLQFCREKRSTHFYNRLKLKLYTTWIKNCTKQNL